jgi:hypothetical protein
MDMRTVQAPADADASQVPNEHSADGLAIFLDSEAG